MHGIGAVLVIERVAHGGHYGQDKEPDDQCSDYEPQPLPEERVWCGSQNLITGMSPLERVPHFRGMSILY